MRIWYTSSTSYCIDSDTNEQYPDGKNYFEHGYVLAAGWPNKSDIWNPEEARDASGVRNYIEE